MIFSRTSFVLRYYGVTRNFHKGSSKLHDQTIGEKLIMKVLNVAEKNDAAKSLAGLLSGGNLRRREGLSKWNKIYEFDYTLMGERCQMIMTSVSGHLLGLEFVGNFRNWQGCNPLALFDAPVMKQCSQDYEPIKVSGFQKIMLPTMGSLGFEPHSDELGRERNSHIRVIQCRIWTRLLTPKQSKSVENSVNMPWMTHPSYQGSPLKMRVGSKSRLVAELSRDEWLVLCCLLQAEQPQSDARVRDPGLKVMNKGGGREKESNNRPWRARATIHILLNKKKGITTLAKFSEITAQSARRAVQNLAQPDRRISDAVDVRQELDLRIG
ncbi:unnamed protein product, partial [Timema podura]|nr:unnamed protein product [Timema podura]